MFTVTSAKLKFMVRDQKLKKTSYSNGHDLAIDTGDYKVNLIHIQFLCNLFALC